MSKFNGYRNCIKKFYDIQSGDYKSYSYTSNLVNSKSSTEKNTYADFELEGNDMFVVTPEGNYFNFSGSEYDESHEPETIIDPKSHKVYTVVFNV